jgi:beta-glucanase (GH16 family)
MLSRLKLNIRNRSSWAALCAIAYLGILCASASAQTLVWSEEFNSGSAPDSDVWSYDTGSSGWGNQELQNYTTDAANVRVEGGDLIITAIKQGGNITSARIKTLDKLTFQYGTIEARIQVPDLADGLWPAFWTLGNDFPSVGWPGCGEIDVMEMGSSSAIAAGVVNRRVGSHLHWGSLPNHPNAGASRDMPSDINGTYVVYRLEWTPTQIRTFIDNQSIWTMNTSSIPEFQKPHFFLLNLAVGGTYTGIFSSGGITAPTPAEYKVDWIRIYDNGHTVLGGTAAPPGASTPYYGTPLAVPGTIEAEGYDNGGENAAYHDTGTVNEGGVYRTSEGVDIEACSDTGGGYNVGWVEAGEWMKYTVDVASAGEYTITSRVARGLSGAGAFHIEVDGVDVTGPIWVWDTGNWQTWADITSSVTLSSGEHVVKIVIEAEGLNINRFELVLDQAFSPPSFTADPFNKPNADEDADYSATLAGSATDPDVGDTLMYSKISGPAWLNVAANGTLSGAAGNADVGPNNWTVEVSDGNGGTDSATLNITVDNVNDDPYFTVAEPIANFPGTQGSSYSGSIAGSATDDDVGDTVAYSKFSGPAWLNVAANGVLSGTPGPGDDGTHQWTVMASDGNGGTGTAVLELNISNINDAPVFTADPINKPSADENVAYSDSIAGAATDADAGDTLTYSKISGPAWLTVAADGTLSGTPSVSDAGANAFTVKVEDAALASDTAPLSITVETASEPPTMSVQLSGLNLEILWPTSAAAMSLYGTTNLLPPVVWSSVTNTPVIQGENWMVTVPIVGDAHFFRLEAP